MRAAVGAAALASLAVLLGVLSGQGSRHTVAQRSEEVAAVGEGQTVEPFRFFSPESLWNVTVRDRSALDPDSAVLVRHFDEEIEEELSREMGPGISTTSYSVPIYTVGRNQPTVRVRLTSDPAAPALQAAWRKVPLPPTAVPSEGTDGTLALWQPSTDRLWEFWRLRRADGSWSASWGGAMENVSHAAGVYGTSDWPGAKPWWGSSASSLSIVGGLITLEDLRQRRINHALAIAIPNVRAGTFSSPARRTDGTSHDPLALPEGAHLRIEPSLDLATIPMPPLTRMIAEAAQKYGIYVRDGSGVAHFFAQDPVNTGHNPYLGPDGYFEGEYPGRLLAFFPWNHLQVLPMHLHTYPER